MQYDLNGDTSSPQVSDQELVTAARLLLTIGEATGGPEILSEEIGFRMRQRREAWAQGQGHGAMFSIASDLQRLLSLKGEGDRERCMRAAKAAIYGDLRSDVLAAIRQVAGEIRERQAREEAAWKMGARQKRGAGA